MNINKAFPSKYLKASDFDDVDTPCTIKRVVMEQAGQGNEDPEKPIIYFMEFEKGLVCNKTNSNIIAKLYGEETDQWTGQKIALWVNHDVQFKGEMVSAVRVRSRAPLAQLNNPVRQSEQEPARTPPQSEQDAQFERKGQYIRDPQTLSFVFAVEGMNAPEHVDFILQAFGYVGLEHIPEVERDQFLVTVQNRIKRASAT